MRACATCAPADSKRGSSDLHRSRLLPLQRRDHPALRPDDHLCRAGRYQRATTDREKHFWRTWNRRQDQGPAPTEPPSWAHSPQRPSSRAGFFERSRSTACRRHDRAASGHSTGLRRLALSSAMDQAWPVSVEIPQEDTFGEKSSGIAPKSSNSTRCSRWASRSRSNVRGSSGTDCPCPTGTTSRRFDDTRCWWKPRPQRRGRRAHRANSAVD